MAKCIEKFVRCPYMPNVDNVREDNIILDEDGVKHVKDSKEYKCLYNMKPIKWDKECPRKWEAEEEATEVKTTEVVKA